MDNVIMLARGKPEPDEHHRSGPLLCLACKHEWVGVSPLAFRDGFECPVCGLNKGVIRGLHLFREEDHWECPCGNQLMAITRARVYCPNCGRSHKPFD